MRYLVVEPHPDDMAFFLGGTISKLVEQGHEVHSLVVTDGQQGTMNPAYDTEDKLASVTREEQRAACNILGVKRIEFLGEKNHFLMPSHELREKITRYVRKIQPVTVITLDPWTDDENPDHRAVGLTVLEACSFAHFHLFHPEHMEQGLKPAIVSKVVLGNTKRPNTHVDISGYLGKKCEAILCYKSQLEMMWDEGSARLNALGRTNPIFDHSPENVLPGFMEAMAAETGAHAGVPFAESFYVRGLGILEHVESLAGEI